MSDTELRPRFELQTEKTVEEVLELLKLHLSDEVSHMHGAVVNKHATIKLPLREQGFWSPQLEVRVKEEDGGTMVKGVYGPRPALWLLFMFIYLVCGLIGLFGLTAGLSQLTMDKPLYGFYAVIPCVVVAICLHLAARYGQRKTRDQVRKLKGFVVGLL